MDLRIDFVSVMSTLGLDTRQRYKLYSCPFCPAKYTLEVFPDGMAKCHNKKCNWSGDGIKLYSKRENVSYKEAAKELGVALKSGYVQLAEQNYDEAKKEFAKDLEFLAWVRIYERFYPDPETRFNRRVFEEKTGLKKGTLSKIINGKLSKNLTWRTTLQVLRDDLEGPIKELQRKLKLGTKYFEDLIDEEQRGKDVEKLRIKKPKRPRAKIADKE